MKKNISRLPYECFSAWADAFTHERVNNQSEQNIAMNLRANYTLYS